MAYAFETSAATAPSAASSAASVSVSNVPNATGPIPSARRTRPSTLSETSVVDGDGPLVMLTVVVLGGVLEVLDVAAAVLLGGRAVVAVGVGGCERRFDARNISIARILASRAPGDGEQGHNRYRPRPHSRQP